VFPEIRRYTLIFLSEPYFVRYLSDLESESGKKDAERGYELMAELLDMEDQPDYVLKSCDQFLHLDERTRLKAHHCLERAHERAPDQHWITALLARSHLRQGNCWRALTLAESVLAANPGDSIARQVRSEARAAMHGL
jgi:hypothetical protein